MNYKYCLITVFFLLFYGFFANAQETIPLYSGDIPNALPVADQEIMRNDGSVVSKVSRPTISIYLPPKEKANGTAVIICPGGGYGVLVIDREGHEVAEAFNKAGVAAFVLKYRLPSNETMKDKSMGPLQDAQQAIKTVRQRASEWNVNPERIGIMGFSAGGHLAASAGTHFNEAFIDNKENISLRPDFMLLVYPVIGFTSELSHPGCRDNLLGKNPSQEQINFFSNELQVTSKTPPAFLLHASDDKVVNVENSIRFYQALQADAVPAGLHIYPDGDHGFLKGSPKNNWLDQCKFWMKNNGLLQSNSQSN